MTAIMGLGALFPKQRLSYKEKTKDDYAWAKRMIDALLLNHSSDYGYSADTKNTRYHRMMSSYQLYNNELNQEDFEKDWNPLGIEVGQFKDEIKAYNKAPNKINVLLGEEYKRPFNFRTILVNSDGIKSKQNHKKMLLQQAVDSYVNNIVSKYTQAPQQSAQEEMPEAAKPIGLEHLEDYMQYTYQDAREKLANNILQYLIKKENIPDKRTDALKHGLLSGEEHVWVGIENGEPVVDVLNSLGVFYHKSPEVKYVQDGLYAGYRTRMNTGDILDKFGDFLDEKDIEKLEGTLYGITGLDALPDKMVKYQTDSVADYFYRDAMAHNSSMQGSYGKPNREDWTVAHVEWRSQKKIGYLKSINKFGEEETILVSEDFVIPPYATTSTETKSYNKKVTVYSFDGMTLTWGYIPEVWEGVRIGNDIFCCIGPKKYQYRSVDNPHKVSLGYHGIIYSAMNAESLSLMERMKPFQYLYFIIAHKFKKLIAKDRGNTFHFDLSMVPESIGLEKTIYYLEEMDIDFFDPLKNSETPGAHQRGKITGSTSRSNMQFIISYVQLLAAIDEQINDVAGVNRQREGQVTANEAVTNTQQNLIQSSTITEAVYFRPHETLWEGVLNSLIQCAQSAWQGKSIVKQYVLDDLSIQTLDVPSDALNNVDIGIFVSNTSKDNELFNELKGLAQPLLQNDKAKFSDIIALMKATSIQDLEMEIKASERKMQEEQMQQIRAQQESQKQAQEMALQMKQMDVQNARELQAQKDAAALEREMVKALGFAKDSDVDNNGVPDVLEIEKLRSNIKLERDKMQHETSENAKDRKAKKEIAEISARKSMSQSK